MTLKEHIDDIREGLETNRYPDEPAVSLGIVLRLLNTLDWPTFDNQVVNPEYRVEGGRVDFALCHPESTPRVFIEVKQVGNIDGAEEQLFRYAFRKGVPIAVLTDGRKWQFFHSTGEGTWAERKVCELDFIKGNSGENAERLNRYLSCESIRTGEAVKAIAADCEQRQIETNLPKAWGELMEGKAEFLVHAVAEKVENLCRHSPTNEQVLDFLRSLRSETERDERGDPDPDPPEPDGRRTLARPKRLIVTMPNGHKINHSQATTSFVEVIGKLGIERVRGLNIRVNTIPLIADFEDPDRGQRKSGQYYIMTGTSTEKKKELLEEIASQLGESLMVETVEKS